MDFSKIVSLGYWFDMYPRGWEVFGNVLLVVLVIAAVAGVVCKIMSSRTANVIQQRFLTKLGGLLLFTGLVGLFFWVVRQQHIPVFAARFWWLILAIIVMWWLVVILKNIKKYQANRQQYSEKKDVFDKYLPKSKK